MRLMNRARKAARALMRPLIYDYSGDGPYSPVGRPESVAVMRELDALPERVRIAVYFAAAKHDPGEVRQVMNERGLSEAATVKLIMRTDAFMVQEARHAEH